MTKETQQYDGWIVSNSFLKRCFGIFGHLVVANMIIGIIVFVILFIFGISIFSLIPKGYFGVGIL